MRVAFIYVAFIALILRLGSWDDGRGDPYGADTDGNKYGSALKR